MSLEEEIESLNLNPKVGAEKKKKKKMKKSNSSYPTVTASEVPTNASTPAKRELTFQTDSEYHAPFFLEFFEIYGTENWSQKRITSKTQEAIKISQEINSETIRDLNTSGRRFPNSEELSPHFMQYQFKESIQSLSQSESYPDPRKIIQNIVKLFDMGQLGPQSGKNILAITDQRSIQIVLTIECVFITLSGAPVIGISFTPASPYAPTEVNLTLKSTGDLIEVLEQILAINGKIAQKIYALPQRPKTFKSFITPIRKLSPKDRQFITEDISCSICHASEAMQCKQCKTVRYCGRQCQVLDWPSHKLICKPLDLEPYFDFKLHDQTYGSFSSIISMHGIVKDMGKDAIVDLRKAHVEKSGKKIIIKAQANSVGPIMIYDKKRSFQTLVRIDVND